MMDAELKCLLEKLITKLDGIDARLTKVEATAHEQVKGDSLARVIDHAIDRRVPRARFQGSLADLRLC